MPLWTIKWYVTDDVTWPPEGAGRDSNSLASCF